ncbi:uncharacterized protein LOC110710841 [Chenopodium quinoa]|uniref:uncharacterized protein LOC110710841 n=1 Tax=Chenopodium quinoa TaxID=63459 RepID=UPI000B78F50B|nr:uncharacterized protein LOC110710841 [Chenopodium quinoa]
MVGDDLTPLPPKYEPLTDYYLHPSEGSQLAICPVLHTVDNYQKWSRSIRNNLRSKSKLGICSTVIIPDDAKTLWDDLCDRYSLGNGPRIFELKHDFNDCKQRDRSVVVYYGELNKLQNLLSSYVKFPDCSCSAAKEYTKLHENESLHQFCLGLEPKKFDFVVSTLCDE